MRYSPDGKCETTLWVTADGRWHLGEKPPYRNDWQGGWHCVRIEVSDFLTDEELWGLIDAWVQDAPRIGGLINFHAWRWWQECLKEMEEEL